LNNDTDQKKLKYQYTAIDFVMLVAAIFICLWSWIFVEADTLQHSQAAQTIVKIITSVVPWVAALERYGPAAHKILLVHSICHLVFTPLMAIYVRKILKNKRGKVDDYSKLVIGLILLTGVLFMALTPYYRLHGTFAETAGRHGYDLLIHPWTMPLISIALTCGILLLLMVFFTFTIDLLKQFWRQHA
jgi:hypothetical protein